MCLLLIYFIADINECKINSTFCQANSTCDNKIGGYDCLCNTGLIDVGGVCVGIIIIFFVIIIIKTIDFKYWHFSIDYDECNNTNICNSNATCVNSFGSYDCECNPGYKDLYGNGTVCEGTHF